MSKFCQYCGAPLKEGERFCTSCGHSVTQSAQPSEQNTYNQNQYNGRSYTQQQPSNTQQPPYAQQPPQQAYAYGGPTPQPPKKKNGLMYVLIGLVVVVAMAVSAVIVFPSLNPLGQKDDKKEVADASQEKSNGGKTLDNGKTTSSNEPPGEDDDWYRSLKPTKEDLEYLKNHPVVATPENSPGNPAFIEVTYSEEEYATAPTYAALVTQDHPEVDFPDLGIHVNMKSWNLDFEQDSLIVKQLPDKVDETTGKILHGYNYSLVSDQHTFLTGVEFTAPVPCDPDAFAGFVTYNEATGRWEDVYCELSEDRRTFTAHLSHFSNGSALETIKTEGSAAIEKYTINGKSIFIQIPYEMRPKYEESSHYLDPIEVAGTADLEFFFNKQKKNETFINRYILGKDNVPEKDILQIVSEWFGVAGTGSDVIGNAGGVVGVTNYAASRVGIDFSNVSDGALDKVSLSCFLVGYTALALDIANQLADNKDELDVLDDKREAIASTLLGFIGMSASCAATETVLFAAVGGGIAAGTLGAAVSVISAIIFASTANDNIIKPIDGWVKKQIIDLKYPLGAPTSIAEGALQCYMEDYAHSDRGFYKNRVSVWDWAWGRQESPEIDSAKVYEQIPQKLIDHNPKTWLAAYDCLVKHHVNNPKKMFQAYDNMFNNFVDAFWNEPTEVKKKYIRMACKKYIEVDMRYYLHNQGITTEEPAMTVRGAEVFHMPKLDTSVYKFTPKAESEWKEIQQDFIKHATRLKKQEKDSRPNDYRMAGKGSDVSEIEVWDAVFHEWDAAGLDNKELRYLGNPEEQKAFFHDKYIALFRYKLTPLLKDYYKKQYHNSIEEIQKLLDNQVLPLLNTRLTFYAKKSSGTGKIYEPLQDFYTTQPDFVFKCDKEPRFKPNNYERYNFGFPLVLKPNNWNAVLLETTVYHYLMYGCPLEVEITTKDGREPIKGNVNWDGVELVQNDHNIINGIEDTPIPIEFKYDIDEPDEPEEPDEPDEPGDIDEGDEPNVKYCWQLVETKVESKPSDGASHYSAQAGSHQRNGVYIGNEYKEYPYSFSATIQAPPKNIEAGTTLVLHATLEKTAGSHGYIFEEASLSFEDESIPMGFTNGSIGKVTKLKGSTKVIIGGDSSGSWDYEIRIPAGSESSRKALNFFSCGSRTHWVYEWKEVSD